MKSNITKKLILYFTAALLVFAVVIGSVFTLLFVNTMADHNKEDLKNRADTIAGTLADFLEGETLTSGAQGKGRGNGQGQGGFGAFLKLADDIAMGEVWMVDKHTGLISNGSHDNAVDSQALPQDGEKLIQDALLGKTGYSELFSELLGVKTMTVCVPAYSSDGTVLAAVLLHAPLQGVHEAIAGGLWTLALSVLIALMLSVLIAVLLSKRFIRPIKCMSQTAKKIAGGDYMQKTAVSQTDEIGELAQTLDELSAQLYTAQRQQEQLEKERLEFYADIAHELRTPITVLRGSLEALQDGKISGEDKKTFYYNEMISEAQYMQNMVNDLLDFSKLKNSDFVLQKEPLNLADVLSDAVRCIRRIAERKQVAVVLDNAFYQMILEGDYAKIRQMFLIVLDNAVKFSPQGETVRVSVAKQNQTYAIRVTDHGPGLKEQDIPHLFERFFRDQSECNRGGTGIGLAIAKQIADRHQILISAASQPNKGTAFQFEVPVSE